MNFFEDLEWYWISTQSILVKNYTHKDGRYYYPGITAKNIAEQKTQGN